MASLNNRRTLFATTSPRTPSLMLPDIQLLAEHFSGQPWNKATQEAFTELLYRQDADKGKRLLSGYKDLVARDRINRSPKKFGFVRLTPAVELTPAGRLWLDAPRKAEILLRQLLKYQLPSPYHTQARGEVRFCVKPYLELFRLIRHLGFITFDEMMAFGLRLTDYHRFDHIVSLIEDFRRAKSARRGSYKQFFGETLRTTLLEIYAEEIGQGKTRTRETRDTSLEKFLQTKKNNLRDYADAIFRHLRGTEMVNLSQSGHSISIAPEKRAEVDYFLATTDREPCFVDDLEAYVTYLGNSELPRLLTDDRERLVQIIQTEFPGQKLRPDMDIHTLKNLLADKREARKTQIVSEQVRSLKNREQYDDIVEKFQGIKTMSYYDNPLMLEWNAWRAMTMLDGGDIRANLAWDDNGLPLSAAAGNMADIVCDYGTFGLTVELTLATGQRQFAMESEPVPRHLGRYKEQTGKQAYGLFIAPKVNEATVAFFFGLHKTPIDFYGGETIIVPLELEVFEKMLADACRADYVPSPAHVEKFFLRAIRLADEATGKDGWRIWHAQVTDLARDWLQTT